MQPRLAEAGVTFWEMAGWDRFPALTGRYPSEPWLWAWELLRARALYRLRIVSRLACMGPRAALCVIGRRAVLWWEQAGAVYLLYEVLQLLLDSRHRVGRLHQQEDGRLLPLHLHVHGLRSRTDR